MSNASPASKIRPRGPSRLGSWATSLFRRGNASKAPSQPGESTTNASASGSGDVDDEKAELVLDERQETERTPVQDATSTDHTTGGAISSPEPDPEPAADVWTKSSPESIPDAKSETERPIHGIVHDASQEHQSSSSHYTSPNDAESSSSAQAGPSSEGNNPSVDFDASSVHDPQIQERTEDVSDGISLIASTPHDIDNESFGFPAIPSQQPSFRYNKAKSVAVRPKGYVISTPIVRIPVVETAGAEETSELGETISKPVPEDRSTEQRSLRNEENKFPKFFAGYLEDTHQDSVPSKAPREDRSPSDVQSEPHPPTVADHLPPTKSFPDIESTPPPMVIPLPPLHEVTYLQTGGRMPPEYTPDDYLRPLTGITNEHSSDETQPLLSRFNDNHVEGVNVAHMDGSTGSVLRTVIAWLCLGVPFFFANRRVHVRRDEEGRSRAASSLMTIGASICLVDAIVLSTSVIFLALPGLSNTARVAGLISVIGTIACLASSVAAVFRHQMELDNLRATGDDFDSLMTLFIQAQDILLSLPVVFLAWSITAFMAGIICYAIR